MRRPQQCSTSLMLSKACWYSWCSSVSHAPWSSYSRGTKTGDRSKWYPITTWEDLITKFKWRLYHPSSECAPGTRLERWDGEAKFEWTDEDILCKGLGCRWCQKVQSNRKILWLEIERICPRHLMTSLAKNLRRTRKGKIRQNAVC